MKLLVVAILGQCLHKEHFWNVSHCVLKSVYEAFGHLWLWLFPLAMTLNLYENVSRTMCESLRKNCFELLVCD